MDNIENRPVSEGTVSRAVFSDPNELEDVSDWVMDFRQIERGPLQTSVRMRAGSMLTLLEIGIDRAVHQRGVSPSARVTFGVPLSEGISSWHGQQISTGGLLMFGGRDGFEGTSDRRFHGITFSFDREQLEDTASLLGLPIAIADSGCGEVAAQAPSATLKRVARSGLIHLSECTDCPFDRADEEDALTGLLLAADEGGAAAERSTARRRSRARSMALDMMEAHLDETLPLSLICGAAGVSVRTLNRAFRERFGIGPKAYHLRLRLGRVRRELRRVGEGELISDVANRYGFWHMGQLAKDYRTQFGELPSETVAARQPVF